MKRRAFSILEVMLVSALLACMLGALSMIFIVGSRYLRHAQTYSHLQQQTAVAIRKLAQELSNGNSRQTGGAPGHVWFLTPQRPEPNAPGFEFDPFGRLKWQMWLCYHLREGGQLLRVEAPLGGSPVVEPFGEITPKPTLGYFRSLSGRLVARDIESLEVTRSGGGTCRILVVGKQNNGSMPCRVEARSQVKLLND